MAYKLAFAASAKEDIDTEVAWGRSYWGAAQAKKWLRELHAAIKQLRQFPLGRPLAPENAHFPGAIRQLIFQRYRVLYTVTGHTVHVLHVRGAYTGDQQPDDADD